MGKIFWHKTDYGGEAKVTLTVEDAYVFFYKINKPPRG